MSYVATRHIRRRYTVQTGLASSFGANGLYTVTPGATISGERRARVRSLYCAPGVTPAGSAPVLIAITSPDAIGYAYDSFSMANVVVFLHAHFEDQFTYHTDNNSIPFPVTDPSDGHTLNFYYSTDAGATWLAFGTAASDNITERVILEMEYA